MSLYNLYIFPTFSFYLSINLSCTIFKLCVFVFATLGSWLEDYLENDAPLEMFTFLVKSYLLFIPREFFTSVSTRSLSDSKSHQVSGIFLSLLINLNIAVVCMVLILPLTTTTTTTTVTLKFKINENVDNFFSLKFIS